MPQQYGQCSTLITAAGLYRLQQAAATVDEPQRAQRSTSCRSGRRAAAGIDTKDAQERALGLGILGELLSNAKPGRRYAGPPLTTNGGGRALVTGGTGGIGEEVCRGLAARGYDVYVGARDAAKGEAVAERLREEFPGAHKCLVCDLNGGDTALPRGVNLLVNNAGVMGAATDETMRVNLVAPARLTLGLRARNRKLRVVNVASSSHLRARACPVARMLDDRRRDKSLSARYAASKKGLLQFTARAAQQWRRRAACHPGLVWTSMLQGFFPAPVRARCCRGASSRRRPRARRRYFWPASTTPRARTTWTIETGPAAVARGVETGATRRRAGRAVT